MRIWRLKLRIFFRIWDVFFQKLSILLKIGFAQFNLFSIFRKKTSQVFFYAVT